MIQTKKSTTHNPDDYISATCGNCKAEYKDTFANIKADDFKMLPEEETGIPDYLVSGVCKNTACKEIFYFDIRTQSEKDNEKKEKILLEKRKAVFFTYFKNILVFASGMVASFLCFNYF